MGYTAKMIVAGIDEAGYGPLLGPLVVGCCAFEIGSDDGPARENNGSAGNGIDDVPCIWKRLRKHVSKQRSKNGRKLHINDSKLVYSPAAGLKELERSVLALAAVSGAWPADCTNLAGLLSGIARHVLDDLHDYDWYQAESPEQFPLRQGALPIRLLANALRQEMSRAQSLCIHLAARVVCERQLNRMIDLMQNKAGALFSVSAIHLDHLLRTYGDRQLFIICDRQGGRGHYGSLLRLMFEDWFLTIVSETDSCSDYELARDGHVVRLRFVEKAEAQCLPVAAASMVSKYLREALMTRFNAYWRQHLPELAPTAGYYADGRRFLNDIDIKRRELGIADERLIRSR